jgi:hypothetical protein
LITLAVLIAEIRPDIAITVITCPPVYGKMAAERDRLIADRDCGSTVAARIQ